MKALTDLTDATLLDRYRRAAPNATSRSGPPDSVEYLKHQILDVI